MLLVLPTTSSIHPASYLSPHRYGYYPSRGIHPHYDAYGSSVPPYPSSLDLFRRPSVEELEEREYQQALEVIISHRRRQAEKEAVIRRQQAAEVASRRYFTALAAELEQRQQEELLAVRRAELIRSQQARADLLQAKHQHDLNAFLLQVRGPQPVCRAYICLMHPILIKFLLQITRKPHVAKHKHLDDVLKQRLAAESDADIVESLKSILSSLESCSVQSDKPQTSSEDRSKLVEKLLSSIAPVPLFRAQCEPTSSTEQAQPNVLDKGKGKARVADIEEPRKPAPEPKSAHDAFADILRHVMELSKPTAVPRSPDEAGPSGSSPSSSSTKPAVTAREQAQIDRAVALSSVEHVQNTLTKLQSEFVLPADFDHYAPSTDDRDETASVSSSDLTKLIPYTSTNKSVFKYENELNGLLEELDRIDSHGDAEVREKRKEVVVAIERALEGVGHVVGEAVEKRFSLASDTPNTGVESLKGFDVDEDFAEVAPVQGQADTMAVDDVVISEPSAPVPVEETAIAPVDVPVPADEALPETDTSIIGESAVDLPIEKMSPESDVEASTTTITPHSVEVKSATGTEVPERQAQDDEAETVDTFLLPEKASPPSPIQKPQQIDSDTDDEAVVLDSDVEKSDWSELEQ